jgi:hypothetical protein
LNKSLKNQIQADIGRIRYLAQAISMKKGSKSNSAGNNKNNKNNNTPQSTKLPTLLSNYESNFASNTTTNNNNRGAITTATTTNNNTNFTNINELLAGGGDITTTANEVIDPADLLDKNRKRITLLKQVLLDLESKNKLLMQKALSREILPPMDGLASNINSSSIFSNNGNINANGGMLIPPTITPPIRKSNSSQSSLKSSSSNRQKQQQQQQQQQQQSVKSIDSNSATAAVAVKEEIVSLPSIKMNRALGMIDLEDSTSLAPLDDPVGAGEGVGDGGNEPDNVMDYEG